MADTNEQRDPVKEARELLQRITQGVRVASGNGVHIGTHCVAIAYAPNTFTVTDEVKANAELYARAPELLKTLCDEVDRLRTQNQTQAESITYFQENEKSLKAQLKDGPRSKCCKTEVWYYCKQCQERCEV